MIPMHLFRLPLATAFKAPLYEEGLGDVPLASGETLYLIEIHYQILYQIILRDNSFKAKLHFQCALILCFSNHIKIVSLQGE